MRAALIATFLAATAAQLPATSAAAPGSRASQLAAAQNLPRATADAPSPAHEPPLIAYALELAETESRAHEKSQYIAATNLRAVTFEMSRHPPPSDKECAHTLGASRFAQQYAHIATIQDELGNFEAVIDAYESALACQPRAASYLASIASAQLNLGHIDEARTVVERGYAINPDDRSVGDVRARLDFIQEHWADATARFRLQVLEQKDSYLGDYARCYLWLAQRRAGARAPDVPGKLPTVKEDGTLEPPDKRWPAQVLDTLHGELSEEALVRVIREDGVSDAREWLTEALFYIGEMRLAEGDTETARRHFASVVNLKVLNFVEYGMARAELQKMRDRNAVADAATAGTEAR